MKRFIKISALTMGALIALNSTVFATTGVITNAASGLIFRKEASKTAEVITTIGNGKEVEVISQEGEWYKVKYNDQEGYLFAQYVKLNEPLEETKTEETGEVVSEYPKAASLASNVHVYSMPTITSTVVNSIERGKEISIQKEIGNWAYVVSGEVSGWIRTYRINNEVKEEVPQETTEGQPQEQASTEKKEETAASITKGYVNSDSINVRQEPNTSSNVVTTLILNTGVDILAEVDNWYKVNYNNEYTGYIRKDLISAQPVVTSRGAGEIRQNTETEEEQVIKTAYVNVSVANVRSNATTSSQVVTTYKIKQAVDVYGEEGDFYKIKLDGKTAYIAKRLLSDSLDEIEAKLAELQQQAEAAAAAAAEAATVTTQAAPADASEAEKIVNFAKQYLGYSYVYGGTTPSGGFDCSGFVYYVFNSCGHSLSRSCPVQAQSGVAVSKSELQPGDIVFFKGSASGTSITHVGIYIGDGNFIHASNPTRGVRTDTLASGDYSNRFHSARRVL